MEWKVGSVGARALGRPAVLQGVYYVVTGVWPLVHIRSFEAVSGPKADRWLVKTVGVLVSVVGTVLLRAERRGRVTPEIGLLGVGSGVWLAATDIVYVAKRRISVVYLLDAAAEVGLVAAWLVAGGWRSDRSLLERKGRRHAVHCDGLVGGALVHARSHGRARRSSRHAAGRQGRGGDRTTTRRWGRR